MFYRPHPSPLPEGGGAKLERFYNSLSLRGRGTQGEGIRATTLLIPGVLTHFLKSWAIGPEGKTSECVKVIN